MLFWSLNAYRYGLNPVLFSMQVVVYLNNLWPIHSILFVVINFIVCLQIIRLESRTAVYR